MNTIISTKKSRGFQSIIDFIFNVNFITIGMLIVCAARAIETQTLYFEAYPADLTGVGRVAASWFMSIAFEWTATTVTVNEKHDKYKTKTIIFAIASVIMTAIFLGVLSFNPELEKIVTQVFLSAVSGYMVYVFAELFTDKAKAERVEIDTHLELTKVQQQVNELLDKLTLTQQQVTKGEVHLEQAHLKVSQYEDAIMELTNQIKVLDEENKEIKRKASRKREMEFIPVKTGTHS